jgi:hypothetical protein
MKTAKNRSGDDAVALANRWPLNTGAMADPLLEDAAEVTLV